MIHLLGGRCVACGDENFYELEIDHIFNDGNDERKYYTIPEKNYIKNPKKSKNRLQVLCKKHHDEKHHLPQIFLKQLSQNFDIDPEVFFSITQNIAVINEIYRIIGKQQYVKLTIFLKNMRNKLDMIKLENH